MNDRIADGRSDAEWRTQNSDANSGAETAGGQDQRTMALLGWALMLAGVVTFFAAVAAVIVAYVNRGNAPQPWRSHFDKIIGSFWIWLILNILGAPLILLFGLGYVVLAIAAIWLAVVGVVNLFRAADNRPA